jgi:hypothetical protein
MWRVIAFVTFAFFLEGCGIRAPELPITYVPQQNAQPIKDSDLVPVQVKVDDLQPETLNYFLASNRHFQVKKCAGYHQGSGGDRTEVSGIQNRRWWGISHNTADPLRRRSRY